MNKQKQTKEAEIKYCNSCNCMTHTKSGYIYLCGKCGNDRRKKAEIEIKEHYKPKDMVIESKYSDLTAIILENGWVQLGQENKSLSLGNYPNARFDIIKRLLAELELREINNLKGGK
jgi:hypothetical protein